jgi:hypothetical protein
MEFVPSAVQKLGTVPNKNISNQKLGIVVYAHSFGNDIEGENVIAD